MGSGKTSVYRYIANKAAQYYHPSNLNAITSTNLDLLMDNMNAKPIQLLALDDAGLETQDAAKELVGKFTYVRHILEDLREDAGYEKNGVIIVLFAVQDYFLLEKKLRSTLHVEILKHAPTNQYDIGRIKQAFGDEAVEHLLMINKKVFQQHKYEYLGKCIARAMADVGYFNYNYIASNETVLRNLENSENAIIKANNDTLAKSSFDGDNYKLLRNLFRDKIVKIGCPVEYARVATCVLLWPEQRYNRRKKKLNPATVELKDIIRKEMAKEWKDEISISSITQAIYQFDEDYNRIWERLTTHDLEEIGETYAKIVLASKLSSFVQSENLNPSPVLSSQSRDFFNSDSKSKPYDLALFLPEEYSQAPKNRQALCIINHKLLTTKKLESEKRFGAGKDHTGLKVLWKTHTRPMREKILLVESLGSQGEVKKAREITLEQLLDLIKKKIQG